MQAPGINLKCYALKANEEGKEKARAGGAPHDAAAPAQKTASGSFELTFGCDSPPHDTHHRQQRKRGPHDLQLCFFFGVACQPSSSWNEANLHKETSFLFHSERIYFEARAQGRCYNFIAETSPCHLAP